MARTAANVIAIALVLGVAARAARADCPEGTAKAACMLHEEGVAQLTAGKFDDAATKFRAAIAAAPSARSYLGYSQAVEGQGKVALAYETMLVAQRLSNEEMAASGGKDAAIVGRAERIKYKLGELGARVAFAWLRLPEGVPPRRLVSIHRKGEGDLPSPLGRWVTVQPDRQVLIAVLDDGREVEVIAALAPGAQGNVVIPISAAATTSPAQPPAPLPTGRPLAELYRQPPEEPAPPSARPRFAFALGLATLLPNIGNTAAGFGAMAGLERRVVEPFAATLRLGLVFHPATTFDDEALTFSGNELVALAGVRTRGGRVFYAGLEGGVVYFTRHASSPAMGPLPELIDDYSHAYPAIGVAGGARIGKLHLELGVLFAVSSGAEIEMPVRVMGSIGFDLVRR